VQAPHNATPQPNLVPVRPTNVPKHPQQRHIAGNVELEFLVVDLQRYHTIQDAR